MAYRAVVFLLALLIAIGAGLFVRRGEREAAAAHQLWPGEAELKAQDVIYRMRPEPKPHPDVVIVAIDDKTVKEYGDRAAWSRGTWAKALDRVQDGGAKVVVFDLGLDERTNKADDAALWREMANGRRTVLGMGVDAAKNRWTPDDVRGLRFLEKFAITDNVVLRGASATQVFGWPHFDAPVSDFTGSARGVGVFIRETDQDGIIRHARLLLHSQVAPPPSVTGPLPGTLPESRLNGMQVVVPNLAVTAARQAFNLDKDYVTVRDDTLRFTGSLDPPVSVPLDGAARMTISYAGPAGTFPSYSLVDVARGEVDPKTFDGKVVIFGSTATGAEATDVRVTPLGEMPRVEITANALSSVLTRGYIARARGNDILATLLGVGLVAGLLLGQARPLVALFTGVGLTLLYGVIAWGALTFASVLMPVLPALVVLGATTVIAVAAALVRQAQRRREFVTA